MDGFVLLAHSPSEPLLIVTIRCNSAPLSNGCMETRALQACDACKRRKVKCDGQVHCAQCTHLNLKCQYSQAKPDARRRRNINRGAVIDEIKAGSTPPSHSSRIAPEGAISPFPSSLQAPSPPGFDPVNFEALAAQYSTRVFPSLPIISESEFRAAIRTRHLSPAKDALVHALAAITTNMARVGPRHPPENKMQVQILARRSLELRGPVMPEAPITTSSVMIPLLVSTCLFSERHNVDMGFYYLRESLTRLLILQRNLWSRLDTIDTPEREQFVRLYWILFLHERYVALSHRRQTLLPTIPWLPCDDSATDLRGIEGLNRTIDMFRVIDDQFVGHWLDRDGNSMSFAWIEQKQGQLGIDMDGWERQIAHLEESQRTDLIVTKYWLHTSIWQMALSKLLLLSAHDGENNFMSIIFPLQLSRRLRSTVSVIPPDTIEIHGTGIVQKTFDITVTIADILVYVPTAIYDEETTNSHLDDFVYLYQFLIDMSLHYPVEESILTARLTALQARYTGFHFTDNR